MATTPDYVRAAPRQARNSYYEENVPEGHESVPVRVFLIVANQGGPGMDAFDVVILGAGCA